MIKHYFISSLFLLLMMSVTGYTQKPVSNTDNILYNPAPGATGINPDTRLEIKFDGSLELLNKGKVYIYDASNDSLVDLLDMSIPPGPKNSRTPDAYLNLVYAQEENYKNDNKMDNGRTFVRPPLEDIYQKDYIGGKLESDVYHFYPILINGSSVSICLHRQKLAFNKTYYVLIEKGVLRVNGEDFAINDKNSWRFKTRATGPDTTKSTYIVSKDGKGDFNTVQGALEYMPEKNPERKTILIKNGRYEEIVYFRNKENLSIVGESRDGVKICYANNGFFNPRPTGERAEMIERFRNRRSVFAIHNADGIHLANLTIESIGKSPAQAEALLIIGEKNIIYNVTIDGSGDALQATGSIYISNSSVRGLGDNVLGYGAVFFDKCEMISTYGPHMWVRNTQENHGNVFINSIFRTEGDVETVFARAPSSPHYSFPYVEAVLIDCKIEGIRPEGWGKVAEMTDDIKYWEFNTRDLESGELVDVSQRHPASRQLSMDKDSEIIAFYRKASNILQGWEPEMLPFIVSQPKEIKASKGSEARISVKTVALPGTSYQWFKNGRILKGENKQDLNIKKVRKRDAAKYRLQISNQAGVVSSEEINLELI